MSFVDAAKDTVTCSFSSQFLWFTCFKSLCHSGRKYNRYGEIEAFILFFFQTCHLGRENDYFVTQTGGKQHMALLTELQNQNWQILEEKKLSIAKWGFFVLTTWSFLVSSCCCSASPTVQLKLVWLLRQLKMGKIIWS